MPLATDNQTDYAAREIARVVAEHFANGGSNVEFAEPQDIPNMSREVERSLAVVTYRWPNVQRLAVGYLGVRPTDREGAWSHGDRVKMINAVVKHLAKIHADGVKKSYVVCIDGRNNGRSFGITKAVRAGGRGDVSTCHHIERVESRDEIAARADGWDQFQQRRRSIIDSQREVLLANVERLFERADREVGAHGAPLTARRSIVVNDKLANDTYGYLALGLAAGLFGSGDAADMRLHLAEYFHVDPNVFSQLHPEFLPLFNSLVETGSRVHHTIAREFKPGATWEYRNPVFTSIAQDIFSWLEMTLRWGRHAPWASPRDGYDAAVEQRLKDQS